MNLSIVLIILQLIVLETLLSVDNVTVLATLVTKLPKDEPVVWPNFLKNVGGSLHKVLGNQRTAALRVGILGAYIGQACMLLAASFIIKNPWLNLVGALYLIHLAFENLGMAEGVGDEEEIQEIKRNTFWAVVISVELADLAFSLDNVVAAVALSNQIWVVILGVFIAMLGIRFAAGWFIVLVEKEPVLKTAAYILVLAIAVELLYTHFTGISIPDGIKFLISLSIIAVSLAYAHFKPLKKLRFVLVWFAHGFSIFNEFLEWILAPFFGLIRLIVNPVVRAFSQKTSPAE
jgi:YkoY family integral membrane protein